MLTAASYSKSGQKASATIKLDRNVFGVTPNDGVLKQVYEAYLANGRKNSAKTKTRGAVSGGGKKPWRQKGTGRARFGSSRNPIWRGGGVAFGPTGNENYSCKITTNTKRNALRQALSHAQIEGIVKILDDFESKDGKTASTQKLLNKLGTSGDTLFVVNIKDDLVKRATKNIPSLHVVSPTYLNVYDVMNADNIIISKKSLEILSEWLSTNVNKVNKTTEAEARS